MRRFSVTNILLEFEVKIFCRNVSHQKLDKYVSLVCPFNTPPPPPISFFFRLCWPPQLFFLSFLSLPFLSLHCLNLPLISHPFQSFFPFAFFDFLPLPIHFPSCLSPNYFCPFSCHSCSFPLFPFPSYSFSPMCVSLLCLPFSCLFFSCHFISFLSRNCFSFPYLSPLSFPVVLFLSFPAFYICPSGGVSPLSPAL